MTFPLPPAMRLALDMAARAADEGEVPVAAVVVLDGEVVAASVNAMARRRDPTAHAEMEAIRAACNTLGLHRLDGCDLYVTLEPCAMCAGAISHARLRRLYFAAEDPKGGAVVNGPRFFHQPTCLHRPDVYGGIGDVEAATMLRNFFAARR